MRAATMFAMGFCLACLASWSTSTFTPQGKYFSESFQSDWSNDTINLVIGNSRALAAIDCAELSKKNPWVHMGYSASDISTQILALKHAEAKAKHIDTIIWEISPFSFDENRVHRPETFCRNLIQSHPPLITNSNSYFESSALFPNRSTLPQLRQKISTTLSGDFSERWACDTINKTPLNYNNLMKVFRGNQIHFDSTQVKKLDRELDRLSYTKINIILLFTPTREDFKKAITNYYEYKSVVGQLSKGAQIIDLDKPMHDSVFYDADHIACPTTFTRDFIYEALNREAPNDH